ncbi:MAG TPA: NAD(P) transhydrogenase subunit alpha [Acidimicrobiales bacterium]|jgi:NAD(P) transhydrogenase subunit alpha|nr:NAD(P) transhydrogenase subunit alpha [Acidimicrobiales bacterium]
MSTGIIAFVTVFVLAAFVGNEVISKVPSVLHTPLMSGSNAIHGIILVGTMIVMGEARGAAQITLAFFAVLLATLNVVGGFVVTDRMLEMFKGKPSDRPRPAAGAGAGAGSGTSEASPSDAPSADPPSAHGGPAAPGTPDTSGDSTPGDAK